VATFAAHPATARRARPIGRATRSEFEIMGCDSFLCASAPYRGWQPLRVRRAAQYWPP
jgi:hypothetical protein